MKKNLLLMLFLLCIVPAVASAHTGLEQATPADGETVTGELSELVLTFNTELEFGSTFYVEDAAGNEVPIRVDVTDQIMTGTLQSDLQNGEYTVVWEIIGVDGHPIEGDYSFIVDKKENGDSTVSTQADPPEGEVSDGVTDEESETTDTETAETASPDIADESQQNSSPAFILIVLLALLVIAGGTVFWLMRRGRTE